MSLTLGGIDGRLNDGRLKLPNTTLVWLGQRISFDLNTRAEQLRDEFGL